MNNPGILFLNKALQSEDTNVFVKYQISEDSFTSKAEQATFSFIANYIEKNKQMPSYIAVADSVKDFVYIPEISDNFDYLIEEMNNKRLTAAFNTFFSKEFDKIKKESKGNSAEIIEKMTDELNTLKKRYTTSKNIGTDLKANVESFKDEYQKRKAGKSFKNWKSKFNYINREIGGYNSGDLQVVYGKSGRGKSFFILAEALEIAKQGANVLLWSLEMPSYDVLTRLYTLLSADLQISTLTLEDDSTIQGGFDASKIKKGNMDDKFEERFMSMLDDINNVVKGSIVIRAVDDYDFNKRNIAQLQADIEATKADVVMIDPMYYLDYEQNTSRTAGGDAAATSMKLRRLSGAKNVCIFAMTQAEEDSKSETLSDRNKQRELKLPNRADVKKTKALLEDAATLIAIDTDYAQNRGIIGIKKGRTGGEGTTAELIFIPRFGVIEELTIEQSMFNF